MKTYKKYLTGLATTMIFAVLLFPLSTWASTTGNFTAPNAPGITVGPGYIDQLVYETVIPDGTNGLANDTLIFMGSGATPWGGDSLLTLSFNEYYLDDNYNAAWTAGGEAVWIDASLDKMINPGEIQINGLADLELFQAPGPGAEYVFDDTATDNNNYDSGEAIWSDVDGNALLGSADTLLTDGTTGIINFNSATVNPAGVCGTGVGGCNGEPNIDDIYWCDGVGGPPVNGVFDPSESILIDLIGSLTIGDYDIGIDSMIIDPSGLVGVPGGCAAAGGVPSPLTVGGPHNVVFLDADKSMTYGVAGGVGWPPPSTGPLGEPVVLTTAPIPDGGVLGAGNFLTVMPAHTDIDPASAPNYTNSDWTPMSSSLGGNLRFIGTSAAADTFGGWEAIVDDGLGANAGILDLGEIVNADTAARVPAAPGTLHQNFPAGYAHTGAGNYDSTEHIFDESTGATPNVLDKSADQLTAITLQNAGTAIDTTDIANVRVWADGGNGIFDKGLTDDVPLGLAVWDGVDSWDLSGLTYAIGFPGQQIFISATITGVPTHNATIQMEIPQLVDAATAGAYDAGDEGVFMISANDGPIDGPLTNANNITIDAQAPVLQSFTSTTLDGTYGPGMGINIRANYDETLVGGSLLTVTLDNGANVLLNNVAGSTVSGTYTIGATGSGEDSLDLTVASIVGASENVADLYGNTQTVSAVPGAPNNIADTSDIVIDTTAPTVIAKTFSDTLITEADVGPDNFYVDIDYNETMSGASTPVVVFAPDVVASGTLALSLTSGWTDGNTYRVYYHVLDGNETQTITSVSITAAADAVGNIQPLNIQLYLPPGAFQVDNQNPTGTASVGTDPLNDSDYVQEVTITYDENMDTSGANDPLIAFGPTVGVISSNLDGSWTSATTWYETFTITDGDETTPGVTVSSSGAVDANGNPEGPSVPAVFNIDTQTPVVTIVLPSNGNATRMATPLAVTTDVATTCTYDLDSAGPVAVANTGGTEHTDVLAGLAAGPHTVVVACTAGANTGTDTSTWTKIAPGNMVLLGTDGAGNNPAAPNLFTLDPETGNILTTIGLVGFNATGIAVDPTTGILYGSTGTNDPTGGNPNSLITIDLTTGAGTLVGPARDAALVDHNLADIAFDSTGQLYGWSEMTDELYAVDKTTGAVTLVGAGGLSTYGSGLIFDLTNTLYLFGNGDDDYWIIDKTTGLPLANPPFLNASGNSESLGSAAVDSANIIFANRGYPSDWAGTSYWDLVVPEQTNGILVSMGGNNPTMRYMNALAIYEDTFNPVVTITAPTKTKTGGSITDTTVRVVDYGGLLAANVTATGGTLNCAQTSTVQVDCTSVISVTGSLIVNATDNVGNLGTATEAGYTINPATGGGGGGSAGGYRTTASVPEEESEEEPSETFEDIQGHWAQDYIEELLIDGYVSGYADNTFRPDQYITRAEAAKIIALWFDMNISDDSCTPEIFTDINCSTDWFAKFVSYLYLKNIIEGYGNGEFMPGNQINRAEALKMMIIAAVLENTDISDIVNPFPDVDLNGWYYNYVMIGYKLNIVQGYLDGTYKPGNSISRAEFSKIFANTFLNK
ncbi:S-layer homology domain-containing protein [Candidatus Peregrinibacteria bacterium]|nr:S-layer homology domain-containing protein [Candidatus Peregrinibacteria bacterium]